MAKSNETKWYEYCIPPVVMLGLLLAIGIPFHHMHTAQWIVGFSSLALGALITVRQVTKGGDTNALPWIIYIVGPMVALIWAWLSIPAV